MALKFINEDTGNLKEAVFCFTGKSPKTRVEMQAIALNAGAKVTKSVTNQTTILVIADASSKSIKAEKARSMEIDLISPSQFFMMCGSVTASNGNGEISQVHIKKPNEKKRHSLVRRIEL